MKYVSRPFENEIYDAFLTHNNPLSNRFREVEIFRPRQQKFKYAFFNPKKTLLSNLQEFHVKPKKWSASCEWNDSRLQALKNAMKYFEELWSNVKQLEVTESIVEFKSICEVTWSNVK